MDIARLRASPSQGELARRRWFFDVARYFTPVLAVDSEFGRLYVSTSDREISRAVFVHRSYERDLVTRTIGQVSTLLGGSLNLEGRSVLEVGANIGTTSLLFARAFHAARVYAYEPVPRNLALLNRMVVANNLTDVIDVRPRALSDRVGWAPMELSEENSGDNRVRLSQAGGAAVLGEDSRTLIEVPVTTVDAEVSAGRLDLSDLALVWIDVQGHEGNVLAGAGALFEKRVPVVLEYWPYALRRAGGLAEFERLITQNYNLILDTGRGSAEVSLRAATEVKQLADQYPEPEDFTDLVLIR